MFKACDGGSSWYDMLTELLSGSIGGFRAISSTQIPKALTETSREADAGPSPPASEEDQPYEIDFTNYGRTTQAPSNYGLRVMTSNDSNEMDFSLDRNSEAEFTDPFTGQTDWILDLMNGLSSWR